MKFILTVGGIAILLTAVATYGPMLLSKFNPDSDTESKQEKELAAILAKKQAQKDNQARQSIDQPNQSLQSTPYTPEHDIQKRLESLAHPDSSTNDQITPTDERSRLEYLSSLPTGIIEATRKQEAVLRARLDAGRANPFDSIEGALPFPKPKEPPSSAASVLSAGGKIPAPPDLGSGPQGLPPPPPGVESQAIADLPPPPPPTDSANGITFDELPPPPEKPLLMRKLKLNAIVGDRVILTFKDRNYPAKHGMRRFITLTKGQEFDTVTLVSINSDKAVLEEDGKEQIVKLDPIR